MPIGLQEIVTRDGAACVWCGRELWRADMNLEHLLPRSRGGRGTAENLVPACRACNRRRGSRPVSAFVREQLEGGRQPRLDLLDVALRRLAGASTRRHADYGKRQLSLLCGYTPALTES